MPKFELLARVAAACAVALIVLIVVLGAQKTGRGKIAWDWPFIVAYLLLFLSIAGMFVLRGQRLLALATAAFVIATAVFDTLENLAARPPDYGIHVSIPKWACFFVCALLTAMLFAGVQGWFAKIAMLLLILGGIAGLVASFTIKPELGRAPQAVFAASGIVILAFLAAMPIFLRNPRLLMR